MTPILLLVKTDNENLPDNESVENFDQTPMYIDHNTPTKKSTKPTSTQTSNDNLWQ